MAFVVEKTIAATLLERTRKSPGVIAFRYRSKNDVLAPKGTWREVSFQAFSQECEQVALGLKRLGLQKGDPVAILSKTRYEWTLADLGIIGAGGITVTLYPSLTETEIVGLLAHSEARMVFVENEAQLMRVLPHLAELPHLKKIVIFETERANSPGNTLSLFDLLKEGEAERHVAPHFFQESMSSLDAGDPFTICYTSGTTGAPKGVVLSHQNLMSVLGDASEVYRNHVRDGKEVLLTFLPFSHIIGRIESMSPFVFGWQLNFADSVELLPQNLKEIRPTILFTVPRIFEKALLDIDLQVLKSPFFIRGAFHFALSVGEKVLSKRRRGKRVGTLSRTTYELFRETVLRRVLDGFGGRLRFAICGGAPLSKEVGERFEQLGVLILEGYGLTETCAPVTVNTIEHHRFGTVGRPLPDVTVRIADDGEILLRSKKIFSRYWRDEAQTRDAFDDEGWFKTGDIGFIDPNGYLHITDRKKDLIITSGGKNISPQKIETLAKTFSPLIGEFVVVGDRRKHISALITLDRKAMEAFAREKRILYSDLQEFTHHRQVQNEIEQAIEELNRGLARFETIKKFAILPEIFSIETGELTPSLKVKRSFVQRKYRELIDTLYHENSSAS